MESGVRPDAKINSLQHELDEYNDVGASAADNAENLREAIAQERARAAVPVTREKVGPTARERMQQAGKRLEELFAKRDGLIAQGIDVATLTRLDKEIDVQLALSKGVKEKDIESWLKAKEAAEISAIRGWKGYTPEYSAQAFSGKSIQEIAAESRLLERPQIVMPPSPIIEDQKNVG